MIPKAHNEVAETIPQKDCPTRSFLASKPLHLEIPAALNLYYVSSFCTQADPLQDETKPKNRNAMAEGHSPMISTSTMVSDRWRL